MLVGNSCLPALFAPEQLFAVFAQRLQACLPRRRPLADNVYGQNCRQFAVKAFCGHERSARRPEIRIENVRPLFGFATNAAQADSVNYRARNSATAQAKKIDSGRKSKLIYVANAHHLGKVCVPDGRIDFD
jgi:hypothetical protein